MGGRGRGSALGGVCIQEGFESRRVGLGRSPFGYYGIWSTRRRYASYWNAFLFSPPATKLGQGYVFTRVCDSVHGGGVCLSACWDTHPPEQASPGSRPPGAVHAGRYGQQAGGTHPATMHTCFFLFSVLLGIYIYLYIFVGLVD